MVTQYCTTSRSPTRVHRRCDGRAACLWAWWWRAWRGWRRDWCPRIRRPGTLRTPLAAPSRPSSGSAGRVWTPWRSRGRGAGRAACGWAVRWTSGSAWSRRRATVPGRKRCGLLTPDAAGGGSSLARRLDRQLFGRRLARCLLRSHHDGHCDRSVKDETNELTNYCSFHTHYCIIFIRIAVSHF